MPRVLDTSVPPGPDTIIRNFRLITTRWNLFVFLLNPALSFFSVIYTALHLSEDSILSPGQRLELAFAYLAFTLALLLWTARLLECRLLEAGYTRRRTGRREFDLLLNLAVCVACYLWLRRRDHGDLDWFWLYVVIALQGTVGLGCLLLVVLGPTLWFTVHTGPAWESG